MNEVKTGRLSSPETGSSVVDICFSVIDKPHQDCESVVLCVFLKFFL